MDQNPINPEPIIINSGVPTPKKSIGPVVGLVIVLALIILGGIYFWMEQKSYTYPEETGWTEDADTTSLKQQDSSDEISAIEADLQATSFESLDKEYAEMNAELSAQ